MRNNALHRRTALLVALIAVLSALPAAAQFIAFPRLGVSAAPDYYEPSIDVTGDETFEIYVIALPPEDATAFEHVYSQFSWWLLEACCGGAAQLVSQSFEPGFEHEGAVYTGVTSSAVDCVDGSVALLCTLTLEMTGEDTGQYYILAAPSEQALTCEGDPVVITDMLVAVNYDSGELPVESTTLSEIKRLFR